VNGLSVLAVATTAGSVTGYLRPGGGQPAISTVAVFDVAPSSSSTV
jgi:hypothetical protein